MSIWRMPRGSNTPQLCCAARLITVVCCGVFDSGEFAVSRSYYNTLLQRQETLAKEVSRKMVVHNTLITTNGLKKNEYSGIFTNTVTMDDLFRESR